MEIKKIERKSFCTFYTNISFQPVMSNSTDVKPFAQVCKMLQSAEWSRTPSKESNFSYKPSFELLRYVHKIATKEWKNMRAGLIHTGLYIIFVEK